MLKSKIPYNIIKITMLFFAVQFSYIEKLYALEFSEHFNGAARIDGESTWIYAEGQITTGDTERFSKFLESVTLWKNQRIVLNSTGGSVIEGIMLGRLIREMGFRTAVSKSVKNDDYSEVQPGICASACVLAFAGGVERGASDGSLVGVHQISQNYDNISADSPISVDDLRLNASDFQIYLGIILEHYMEMGIDPSIVPLMVETAPDDIRWLTFNEVHSTKIAFSPNEFGPWRIEGYRDGLVAFSRSADERKQITLFCTGSGTLQYLLRVDGEPHSTSFLNDARTVQNFIIAGTEVSASDAAMESKDGSLTISGHWAGSSNIPKYDATFSLFGEMIGAMSDIYSFYHFNNGGFTKNVELARKNCI